MTEVEIHDVKSLAKALVQLSEKKDKKYGFNMTSAMNMMSTYLNFKKLMIM